MIPLDSVTEDTVHKAGWQLDDVLPANERLIVRHTANLHTGGTIHDVTDELNPMLAKVAVDAVAAVRVAVRVLYHHLMSHNNKHLSHSVSLM